ncbi:MAG TPA: protein-glutamate O-methyltransferase CheR [Polyangiaceae bacterium]|nr:protein-glutamate O-methyltransferase CheR [Polyangiaceae bacterium]
MARNVAESLSEVEDLEITLLLEGVYKQYGFDFRHYARASLRRRILRRVEAEGVGSISRLLDKVLRDPDSMEQLLLTLTIHVTAMFRDPEFYVAFRSKVVPLLKTYPFIRIWHAGCSSGEEVYSMAILLEEEGIYDRCRLYATDLSEAVLRTAQTGIFPLSPMKEYTENYLRAGGKRSLSHYYKAKYDNVLFSPSLRQNVVFAQHDLVTGGSFNEFNVILCRNVMIYFDKILQDRVHGLIYQSLARFGVLGLGLKESLRFTPYEGQYSELDSSQKLYRKTQ